MRRIAPAPRTIIFDLDGTLYEDDAIFDVYAGELSTFIAPRDRGRFLDDWGAAKARRGVAAIGLGYEEATDRLFRFEDNRILGYLDWDGREAPADDPATAAEPDSPSLFGQGRFNIGDLWWLPAALAGHYKVTPEQRERAFLATRSAMSRGEPPLTPVAGVREMLSRLKTGRHVLIAMTNSPRETTDDVLCQLGLRELFDQIRPLAGKPAGLTRFLVDEAPRRPVLSVGDNFVNDIAPCLAAGGAALYIDRYGTKLDMQCPRCTRVRSAQEMVEWLNGV